MNTIQDIAVSSAPTFGRLTVTSSQASTAASQTDPRSERLSLRICVGWSLGTLGLTTFMVGSYLLLRFMTDYMAVPPAVAGTIFALAKIYDGIADPIIGSFSDRSRSRWGRRRPFLLGGAFACALTFMLAFNAPIVATTSRARKRCRAVIPCPLRRDRPAAVPGPG